jgi:subtilisin family serine protease
MMARLVLRPAGARNAITVGSYDWNPFGVGGLPEPVQLTRNEKGRMNVGKLSAYSSPGPARVSDPQEQVKPDLVAPGQWFVVNKPDQGDGGPPRLDLFNGTSAATPYVAGVVALMFEARPTLTAGEVRGWLYSAARKDDFTREAPDGWGRGKLTADSVKGMLKDLKDGKPLPKR